MDGEWEPPQIDNPDYKGEWKPKQIKNPEYKGKWIHPEIDNPEYQADDDLYKYDDFGAIGIDIWQVKSGSIFDNVLVCDSIEEAKEHAKQTFEKTKEGEKKMKDKADEEERKKMEEEEKKRKEEEDAKKKDDKEKDDDEEEDEEKQAGKDELWASSTPIDDVLL